MHADLIIHQANIYVVDTLFSKAEAIAIKDGKIVAVGTNREILKKHSAQKIIDAQSKYLFPGFIDAHCHLLRYAASLNEVDLVGTGSFEEILAKIQQYRVEHPEKQYIIGRGWNNTHWLDTRFPNKKQLDELFPDIPILLYRIDLHAALANQRALDWAKISVETKIEGGIVEKQDGCLTGMLIDYAIARVANALPQITSEELGKLLLKAQANCFKVGLTTINEALIERGEIDLFDNLQKAGKFKMRVYCMVNANEANRNFYLKHGCYKTDRLNVRCFKYFADGALGSRGAWLLNPYTDQIDTCGLQLLEEKSFVTELKDYHEKGFQVATHAIGDAANRLVINAYAQVLQGKNDLRWRLEHAQIVAPSDMPKFGAYSITPSIQTTHATSDMPWVGQRLGIERLKKAYCYRELLQQNKFVANGSDFPVEQINPLLGFYAAVARQDAKGWPTEGFQMENALTREEALKAMTIWAAYSNFEEQEKGSLEVGKFADFVLLDKDIMEIPIREVLETRVLRTFINGEEVNKL